MFSKLNFMSAPANRDPVIPIGQAMAEKKAKRIRLNKVGTSILEEYLIDHPTDENPSRAIQESLLERVRKAQNCNEIKLLSITSWFQRQRQKNRSALQVITPFSEAKLHNLYTLTQATPQPSLEVLQTWAKLFGVSVALLEYMITTVLPKHFPSAPLKNNQEQATQLRSSPSLSLGLGLDLHSQRLPTPADSLISEPTPTDHRSHFTRSPEYFKDELSSPVLAPHCSFSVTSVPQNKMSRTEALPLGAGQETNPNIDQPYGLQPSPPPTPIVSSVRSKPPSAPQPTTNLLEVVFKPSASPLQNAIYLGVQKACVDALSTKGPSRPPPSTTSESDARFAPYQGSLERLSYLLELNLPSSSHDSTTKNKNSKF